jgi:LacI family transcriptional regulator
MKVPTQKDIAEAVGVSRETVSHILGGKGIHRYNEETRQKVLEAANALGYRPNRAAQTIRKGRSNLVGVIHFGTSYHIARQTAHFLPQAINGRGYDTFVVDLSWHGECHRRALDQLVEARVEGVIIAHMVETFGRDDVQILTQAGIPALTLAGNEKLGIPVLYGDSRGAFRDLVTHLGKVGHKRFLLLTTSHQGRTKLSRVAGFRDGLHTLGHPDVSGEIVELEAERGGFDSSIPAYQYVRRLIQAGQLPDAIVCTNDHWARGAFAAALEAGLKIPEDLAVTGFDNEPFGAMAPYFLTTATPDVGAECEKAAEVMADLIANKPLPQREYIFPCELVIRRSCGAREGANILTGR